MIVIDSTKCIGCGRCVDDCLNYAIKLVNGRAVVTKPCFMCGHCIAICPRCAVSADNLNMDDVIPLVPEKCTVPPDIMLNTIKCRRTVRHFTDEIISKDKLDMILEAGRFSPTASNRQGVSYRIFKTELEELRRISMEEFRKLTSPESFAEVFPPPMSPDRVDFSDDNFLFKGAETVILVVSPNPIDAGIASAHMELVGDSLGLGTVYSGFFVRLAAKNARIREFIGVSESDNIATCLCFGHPAVKYLRSVPRKPLKAVWR